MKLLTTILLFISLSASATNYYIDDTGGNDTNDGLTAGKAWRTLTKVNAATYAAGDSILFKRGGVWYGSIIVNRSNINFGAYGSGAKPVISGAITLSSWVPTGGNKWRSSTTVDSVACVLTVAGELQTFAQDTTGWRTFTAVDSNTIIVPHSGSWVGKQMVMKPNDWTILRVVITADSANYLTYRQWFYLGNGSALAMPRDNRSNYGCYLINDTAYLDTQNEWVLTSGYIYLYSSTEPANVKVCSVDTLLNLNGKSTVSIDNIAFEYGSLYGIYGSQVQGITVTNCSFNYGAQGIGAYRLYNSSITGNTFTNLTQGAIYIRSLTYPYSNITVSDNTISKIGLWYGMGSFGQYGDYSGMNVSAFTGLNVLRNSVDSVGDAGIKWAGSVADIGYNSVSSACNKTKDRAGVYTFQEAKGSEYYYSRRIHNNFIYNIKANIEGTSSATLRGSAIYMDGTGPNANVIIDSNVCYNYPRSGVNLNCDSFVTVTNNIFVPGIGSYYASARVLGIQQVGTAVVRNFRATKNISYLYQSTQVHVNYEAGSINDAATISNFSAIGTIDSNYFNTPALQSWVTIVGSGGTYKETKRTKSQFTSDFGFGVNDTQLDAFTGSNTLLLTNWSATASTQTFSGSYKDAAGTVYTGSVTLQPYTGIFLIRTATVPVSGVRMAFKVQ